MRGDILIIDEVRPLIGRGIREALLKAPVVAFDRSSGGDYSAWGTRSPEGGWAWGRLPYRKRLSKGWRKHIRRAKREGKC